MFAVPRGPVYKSTVLGHADQGLIVVDHLRAVTQVLSPKRGMRGFSRAARGREKITVSIGGDRRSVEKERVTKDRESLCHFPVDGKFLEHAVGPALKSSRADGRFRFGFLSFIKKIVRGDHDIDVGRCFFAYVVTAIFVDILIHGLHPHDHICDLIKTDHLFTPCNSFYTISEMLFNFNSFAIS